MDILKLKKILLIAFYVGVIVVGVAGFLALRSMREITPPLHEPQQPAQEQVVPRADSTTH